MQKKQIPIFNAQRNLKESSLLEIMLQYNKNTIFIFNRESQSMEKEKIYAKKAKDFFYNTFFGRIFIHLILKRKYFSCIYGYFQKQPKSCRKINAFVQKYNINTNELEKPLDAYKNFNDFFIRRLQKDARPIDSRSHHFIAPADSRLLALTIDPKCQYKVKGFFYNIDELVHHKAIIKSYYGGLCLIFRLTPADYHRFCFVDNGIQQPVIVIKGHYQASGPQQQIARYFPLYHKNYRQYCVLNTQNFDDIIQIEVGAIIAGKIIQHYPQGGAFRRGKEKGYFELGGSTIVLLIKPKVVKLDEDIVRSCRYGIEVLVQYGTKIGQKL